MRARKPSMISGSIQPTVVWVAWVRPKLNPFFRKRVPIQMPNVRPSSPKMALPSPPASRRTARHGQPRKTRAPIMAKTPRTKRTMGADPTRGRNSLKRYAAIIEPMTNPMISGRIYCTTAARWRPIAPAMSRSKQATQMPIFPGLPNFCNSAARMPIIPPTLTIPHRPAKKFFMMSASSFPRVAGGYMM